MYTLENCESLWAEAVHPGTPEERIARTKAWLPYYSYLSGTANPEMPEPHPAIALLLQDGALTDATTVLDIGAGMGGDSLHFARHAHHVTAVDPSKDCLGVLWERASRQEITNIETVESTFEAFVPPRQYDLVYSAMCPAICDLDALRRMESMAKRTCCLVSVMRGSVDRHRRSMMQALNIKPTGGMVTEAIHYIQALYLLGRQPNMRCITRDYTTKISREQVLEQYPIYFGIFGVPTKISVPFLESYLEENAIDGFLTEESKMNQAIITWNVTT
jgi:SAM-dependent methyltransferase